MSNMSAMMPSQPLVPRMQFGLSGGNRTLNSQNMSDIIFLDLNQNLPKALMRLINMEPNPPEPDSIPQEPNPLDGSVAFYYILKVPFRSGNDVVVVLKLDDGVRMLNMTAARYRIYHFSLI
ncbi:hypothetical protein Tco_0035067, partial [Tanacetum coccineum]